MSNQESSKQGGIARLVSDLSTAKTELLSAKAVQAARMKSQRGLLSMRWSRSQAETN
jgi:hypothetical protein